MDNISCFRYNLIGAHVKSKTGDMRGGFRAFSSENASLQENGFVIFLANLTKS